MEEDVDELIAKAKISFSNNQYESALSYCKMALELEPNSIIAYSLAGNICLVWEKLVESENYFCKAIELDGSTGERYFELANSQFGQKKYAKALENYARAEQLGCSNEVKQKIYYLMGILNQYIGEKKDKRENYKNALINYEKSARVQEGDIDQKDILLKRIQIYLELGDLENAENCATQLKLLAPQIYQNYHLLLQLLLEQQKIALAENILMEAKTYCKIEFTDYIEMTFDEALIYCFKAEQDPEYMEKNYRHAINSLMNLSKEKDISLDVQYESIVTIAEIYLKLKDVKQAVELVQQIANFENPDLLEYIERARFILVEGLTAISEYEKARIYAHLLKESKDLFYQQHGFYSEAYIVKKLSESNQLLRKQAYDLYIRAIAYYKNCMIANPGDYTAILYRVKSYADIGKYNEAKELCNVFPKKTNKELTDYIEKCKLEDR